MRSSSLPYSASGFGALLIAACTSFGIRETPVTALIGQRPRAAALNSVHNNPRRAYAATPRTGVAPCHASLVWRLFGLLLQEEYRRAGRGRSVSLGARGKGIGWGGPENQNSTGPVCRPRRRPYAPPPAAYS